MIRTLFLVDHFLKRSWHTIHSRMDRVPFTFYSKLFLVCASAWRTLMFYENSQNSHWTLYLHVFSTYSNICVCSTCEVAHKEQHVLHTRVLLYVCIVMTKDTFSLTVREYVTFSYSLSIQLLFCCSRCSPLSFHSPKRTTVNDKQQQHDKGSNV